MPPNKRIHKKTLKLDCEWGTCQESFSRMENFCKHAEDHLDVLDVTEEAGEVEGELFNILEEVSVRPSVLLSFKLDVTTT